MRRRYVNHRKKGTDMKRVCIYYMLGIAVCLAAIGYGEDMHGKKDELKNVKKVIPEIIWQLSEWPDAKAIEDKAISASDEKVLSAANQSRLWIQKVVDPALQPTKAESPICLRSEVDGRDVVRMQWSRTNYSIEVSQTASVFLMKVTPESGQGTGKTYVEKQKATEDIFLGILAKEGRQWTDQGEEVAISRFAEKVVTSSFKDGQIRKMVAKGGVEILVGLTSLQDGGAHWFENVSWWNDGSSVHLYFLKSEGGPWIPSYAGNIDKNWFSLPKDRRGRSLKNSSK